MRLIDADALLEKLRKTDRYFMLKFDIESAPTVIRPDWGVDNGDKTAYARPTGEYQKRALELINTLEDEHKITVRQVGTLRRAILAEPDRPTGEWKEHDFKTCGGLGDWDYKCSNCEKVYCGKSNYCPNCGAKMKGVEE